jgi:glutamate dehydrogenase
MRDEQEQAKRALIDATVELARGRYREMDPDRTERLLREYYRRAAPLDLAGKEPTDLYAAALRHWQLGRRRLPGETLVRVYDPSPEEDGWHTEHTVLDVVNDDMPFIVDSVAAELQRRELTVHVLLHPLASVTRDADGDLLDVRRAGDDTGPDAEGETTRRESFLHVELDRLSGPAERERVADAIREILGDVRDATADWRAMSARAMAVADELDGPPPPGVDAEEWTEAAALLRWLVDEHFTFLGFREYELRSTPDGDELVSVDGTGLGLQRDAAPSARNLTRLSPRIATLARSPRVLNLTKANRLSTVHRAVPLDYVGVKRFAVDGTVLGERRFLGLYTAAAYAAPGAEVPVVRRRLAAVVERAGFLPGSHDANRLRQVLGTLPRDELLQYEADDLYETALGIIDLRDRRRVSLFVRRETYGRWLSCLVLAPRDRYNTDVRLRMQRVLLDAYRGVGCTFSTVLGDDPIARVHIQVLTEAGIDEELPETEVVRERLERVTRRWEDDLRASLRAALGEQQGLTLFSRYHHRLPGAYAEDVLPDAAVADIVALEALGEDDLSVRLLRPLEAVHDELRLRVYRTGGAIELSSVLPLLHDLGARVLDERPYEIRGDGEPACWIYDMGLRVEPDLSDAARRQLVEEAFVAAWRGEVESDGFAGLVTRAGLAWREVVVLRACARYLRQVGTTFSPSYVEEALLRNAGVAALLARLFALRFDPDLRDVADEAVAVRAEIDERIDAVTSLDEDRILRSFRAVVEACVRTNHYRSAAAGAPARSPALALKLDPSLVPDIPRPVPAHEVFVYSPRTEGVHLRMGRVARGGLRWSDRREDYRTEILGLVKAQSVKNAVIVPVGAKGGFVAKRLPLGADRSRIMEEVAACYDVFVGALLDLTDDLDDGRAVPPDRVVRHDGDDPYLVVAADKGTATFSDRANALAIDRGFWLGDAFASGGSVGYDHKALGITARGAWVSVQRHFRELGLDADRDPITVVGVGDMSGDVFGNGLLRSPNLRLVAAFDHRHVFVDPDPDPARSYEERRRLFDMPGSSWADYDPAVLSAGGGVFDRSRKSVPVSPEIRAVLAIGDEVLTPAELIRAVLCAPVDLLWNGGIGTYVKASTERHEDVGDRANDAVRIDAAELRCRVVGEGGNLGLTQRGRIEFALRGGSVNTDAIDNSGGVDCSDHEVNLKILLDRLVRAGEMTARHRDELLVSLADEVCELVLADNDAQNVALSGALAQASEMVDVHVRHLQWLERVGGLDRELEALPTDDELTERRLAGGGLSRPELAVLLAYTKNAITAALLESDLPEDPAFDDELIAYFPAVVRQRYPEHIRSHPLRRELVATVVTNRLVNRAGISMAHRLADETSASMAEIARAQAAAWRIHGLDGTWSAVEELDPVVDASVQTAMLLEVKRLGERATRWILRNRPAPLDVDAAVRDLAEPVTVLSTLLPAVIVGADRQRFEQRAERFVEAGVPEPLAVRVAAHFVSFSAMDLTAIASSTGAPLDLVARTRFLLDDRLELSWLREHILSLPRDDHWQSLARSALIDDYYREHAALTARVVGGAGPDDDPESLVAAWVTANAVEVERCHRVFADLRATGTQDLARVSVALRELRQLLR